MKLYGISIDEKTKNLRVRNPSKAFPWQVIDKSNKSHHPLWFQSFNDLASFYKSRDYMWKEFVNDLRIIKTDENGKEIERYAFEI